MHAVLVLSYVVSVLRSFADLVDYWVFFISAPSARVWSLEDICMREPVSSHAANSS